MNVYAMPIVIGQRFRQFDGRDQDQVVTVVRLDEDAMGFARVVFEAPGGREVCAYATQVVAAVADGDLTPEDDLPAVMMLDDREARKLAS